MPDPSAFAPTKRECASCWPGAAGLESVVIDAGSRAPVKDYAIYHGRRGRDSSEDLGRPKCHDRGRAVVGGLTPGSHLLRVVPTELAFAVGEPPIIEVDALHPRRALTNSSVGSGATCAPSKHSAARSGDRG